MNFYDADAYPSCDLAEGEPVCLRRRSDFCAQLAAGVSSPGLRAALEKLSLDLARESDALERERAVLGNKLQRD
jgi:hypothetical protein